MADHDQFQHERSHFSASFFERMGAVALSAAGFSAALVFFLAQASDQDAYTAVSLWAALASLILWLCAWQYVEPYSVHGAQSYGHFNFFLATAFSGFGLISLLVAVAAVVLKLSVCAGVAFSVLSVLSVIWATTHNQAVSRHCKSRDA
jgi:hypothetical protein